MITVEDLLLVGLNNKGLPVPLIVFDEIDGPSHVHANGDPAPCPRCKSRRDEVVLVGAGADDGGAR